MKKFVVIFIIVAVVLSGTAAFLQFRRVDFTYKEIDGGAELTRYAGISTEKEMTVSKVDNDGNVVISLGDFSISNCDYLETINIGPDVTMISEWAITNNRKLQRIIVDEANPNYSSVDGVLYNKDLTELIAYPNSKDVKPVMIEKEEFLLGDFTVPDSVIRISNNAFYKCKNIATVTFNSNVTYVGDRAFHECDRLRDIAIPEGVTYIGVDAYSYNNSIVTEVIIPSTVTEIGNFAFFNAQAIPKLVFNGSEAKFNDVKKGKQWIPIPAGKLWGSIPLEFREA